MGNIFEFDMLSQYTTVIQWEDTMLSFGTQLVFIL